ncbi:MAG: hypothetical protein QOJ44_1018 [Acidimicrobiaceae bacterium]|jgi:hypothetical protein|nr:hypothetical protein [Acidimicrobiaceae bacterium]
MAPESKDDLVTSDCGYKLATRQGRSTGARSGRRIRPVA